MNTLDWQERAAGERDDDDKASESTRLATPSEVAKWLATCREQLSGKADR